MTKAIHDQNAHMMISIWPNPSDRSTAGKALKEAGFTLAGTTIVNMFDPKARELYWKSVWQILASTAWTPGGAIRPSRRAADWRA